MSYDAAVRADAPTWYFATRETTGTTLADDMAGDVATITGTGATLGQSGWGGSIVEWAADSTYAAATATGLSGSFVIECIVEVYADSAGSFVFFSAGGGAASAESADVEFGMTSGPEPFLTVNGYTMVSSTPLGVGRHHIVAFGNYSGSMLAIRVDKTWAVSATQPSTGSTSGAHYIRPAEFGVNTHYGLGKIAVYNGLSVSTPALFDAHYDAAAAGGGDEAPPPPPPPTVAGTRLSWDGGITVGIDGYGGGFEPVIDPGPAPTAPAYSRVQALVVDSSTRTGLRSVPSVRLVADDRDDYRIVVGGKDVTWFRGVKTPMPTYSLVSPLRYGSGSLTFPQIHAALETPGSGSLSWLTKFARVKVQRVRAGAVVATDYIGFVSNLPPSGRDFTVALGGEATGLAAMQDRPVPIFPQTTDIGSQVMRTIQHQLRLPVANEPATGIEVVETGGMSQLDFLTEILAKSTQRDGIQWTVEPNQQGQYRMQQKDLATIDATVYIDGFRVVESLTRDFTEEPNRVWAQGVDPDGKRVRFAIFPGLQTTDLAYPGSSLSAGDSGDNVTALIWRLYTIGYLDGFPPSGWTTDPDDPVTAAIVDVQKDAGLTSFAGVVDAATWRAIFRGDNFSLRRSQQRPAAQKRSTMAFLRDATGNIIGPNPDYDRTKPLVDVSVDMGSGFTRRQMQKWAEKELADPDVSNWVGTITVNTGAVIDGEHNPGDPLTSANVRDARSIKPGHNLWLPNWDGGTLVHVSGCNPSADSVEFTVDTRARDTMKVWEVIRRNRESRKSPSRQWIAQNRRSGMRDDTGAFYDGSVFGKIERTFCPGGTWTIIPTPAGRSGTLQKVQLSTDDSQALFVTAIFGKQVGPGRLANVIGDPTTNAGTKNWEDRHKTLSDDMWLVYSAGGVSDDGLTQLCGYWPERVKADPTTGTGIEPPVTGEFRDEAGVAYFCEGSPVLWLAIYPDRDCHVQGGRVLEILLDDAAG